MRKITKRSAAIISATVIAVGGAGAAWAFTSWGDGAGTANATTSTIVPLSATATVSGNLFPGQSVDLTNVSVTNTNDYDVKLTGATLDTVEVVKGGTDCTQAKAALSLNAIPADRIVSHSSKAATNVGTFTNFITMNAWANPDCSNAVLKVNFKITGNPVKA
jgi:hypothetical protein